jgi:Na+-translocating membrane potential-generating system (MpsC)
VGAVARRVLPPSAARANSDPPAADPEPARPAPADAEIGGAEDATGAISRDIVQVYLRTFGRGPTRARTFVQPQFAVCVLRDVFTTAERALIADGDGDRSSSCANG